MGKVINVRVPEPDPEATKRVWQQLEGRPDWTIWDTDDGMAVSEPPPDPPERPTTNEDRNPDDEGSPTPYPVAEIDLHELQVMKQPEWSGVLCSTCGGEMVRTGACYSCPGCGDTTGCG